MGIDLPYCRRRGNRLVHYQTKIWDPEPLENALEAKIGNFAHFKNTLLAITTSRDDKYRGSYTSIDREFQGGSNDMSRAVLKRKFEKSDVFFIFNNGFLAITISRGDKCWGCYTSIDREFQGGSNGMSRVALKRKSEKPGVFFIFNNGFSAITISRDDKYRGCYTSIDREFHAGSNDMSCAALKRKFEKPGAFFIFNNGFLAITISRGLENIGLIYQSIENLNAVILVHNSMHFFSKLGSVFRISENIVKISFFKTTYRSNEKT